jgi:GNAT superfamily N-acetyltransferase
VIRPSSDADADAAAALIAANSPWLQTAAGLRHRARTLPPRARRATWVAEQAGQLVGWAEAEFDWTADASDVGQVWAVVAPDHRRRGVGSALFERAFEHVLANGATEVRSWSFADSDSFLEGRGFVRARLERLSSVDPRTVDTSPLDRLPAGVRVLPLRALDEQLDAVYGLFVEALADMPADHPERNLSFDEWRAESLADPDLSLDGSAVVLVGDRPAALSWVSVDASRGVAEQHLTGTARFFRRRGLGRLAKLGVMRWCADNGITRLTTGNDATNVGMLAINTELGFRPFATETEWVKHLA